MLFRRCQSTCVLCRPLCSIQVVLILYGHQDGQTLYKTIEDDNSCQPYILLVIKLDVSRNLVTGLPDLSRRINLHMLYFLNCQTPPILPSFSRLGWAECDASSHSRSLPTITSTCESLNHYHFTHIDPILASDNIHIETSWETLGTATAVTNYSLGSRNHVLSSVITPVEDEGYISDSSTRWLEDVD